MPWKAPASSLARTAWGPVCPTTHLNAHNYQRFARSISFGGKHFEVPFIVCGDGGHNVTLLVRAKRGQPAQEPPYGLPVDYIDVKPVVASIGLILK